MTYGNALVNANVRMHYSFVSIIPMMMIGVSRLVKKRASMDSGGQNITSITIKVGRWRYEIVHHMHSGLGKRPTCLHCLDELMPLYEVIVEKEGSNTGSLTGPIVPTQGNNINGETNSLYVPSEK